MKRRSSFFSVLTVSLLALILACTDEKPTGPGDHTSTSTTEWNNEGYWVTTDLNASSYTDFTFYNFTRRDTVTLSLDQARSSTNWHLGLGRVNVLINSGDTGPGQVLGVDLAAIGHPDSTNFMGFSDPSVIDDSDFSGGNFNLAINEWYTYDPFSHSFELTHYVYIMQDAEGGFLKFQIISMVDNGQPPNMGTVLIQFVYSDMSRNLTGMPDTLTFDGSAGGPIFVDFSAGTTTQPADPQSSTEWDIAFEAYEVHQNNTVFGSGQAGTYEVWQDQSDPTDFNETMMVPMQVPFFADQFGSPLTEWYNYVHPQIFSKNHVYVIRDGDLYYKLQILAYYNHDTSESGYYTFRWVQL